MKKVKSKKLFIGDIIQSDCNKKKFFNIFLFNNNGNVT